jgi:DNA-binding NarL/FixJ family response regulator
MYKRMVVVVENEDFIRSLIAGYLENAGFRVSTAATGSEAKRIIDSVDPDAVVLDIDLGYGPSGIDIADWLTGRADDIAIVFLTSFADPRFAGRDSKALHPRAAYLNKNMLRDADVLVEALETVLNDKDVTGVRHDRLDNRPLAGLSSTQIQILQLVAEGKTNQQIADIRKRSLAATESAITRTLKALGIETDSDVNSRVLATRIYIEEIGIITPTVNQA